MDHVLVVFVLLWSSGLQTEEDPLRDIDEVRLVGGSSRCSGELEVKHENWWGRVDGHDWNLKSADEVCRKLDCGSVLQAVSKYITSLPGGMSLYATSEPGLTDPTFYDVYALKIFCSDSVRLVNGTSLCSGRLEVKSDQSNHSNQWWSSVCETDFDQQDAEVVCRELGCGAPSVLQGALYGEGKAPKWTREFQCGGNESSLLDCRSSDSARTTCSPGKAVGLTCSEPDNVRLVRGWNRCAGKLQVKQLGRWRKVIDPTSEWNLTTADPVCRNLDCGSAVWTEKRRDHTDRPVWQIPSACVQSESAVRECVSPKAGRSSDHLEITCTDFLTQPNISFFAYTDGVSEATQQGFQVLLGSTFTISCSSLPKYPGGSFQLILTTSAKSQNYSQAAVNHSAHFLFSAADHTHRGDYRCVFHLFVFSRNFSSQSQTLRLTVSASLTELRIRVFLLIFSVFGAVLFFCSKSTTGKTPRREDDFELGYVGTGDSRSGS